MLAVLETGGSTTMIRSRVPGFTSSVDAQDGTAAVVHPGSVIERAALTPATVSRHGRHPRASRCLVWPGLAWSGLVWLVWLVWLGLA